MYKYGSSVDKLKEGIFSTLYKIGEEKYKDFEHFSKNYMASVTNCYRSSANFIAVSVLRKMLESFKATITNPRTWAYSSCWILCWLFCSRTSKLAQATCTPDT